MSNLKIKIPPDQESYSRTVTSSVLSAQLEGGAARYRQDLVGANTRIAVQWTTDSAGLQYLNAFYLLTGAKGLPFDVDLVFENATMTTYAAHFVPGSWVSPASVQGATYRVKAEIEVYSAPPTDASLTAILNNYTGY